MKVEEFVELVEVVVEVVKVVAEVVEELFGQDSCV